MAASVKKATQIIGKQELNAIEPVKKRKVNWPCKEELKEEEELLALDAELKDFNYSDLDKLELKDESNEEKKEGEMDVSDEVSV